MYSSDKLSTIPMPGPRLPEPFMERVIPLPWSERGIIQHALQLARRDADSSTVREIDAVLAALDAGEIFKKGRMI